jgi:hypothetical protein
VIISARVVVFAEGIELVGDNGLDFTRCVRARGRQRKSEE